MKDEKSFAAYFLRNGKWYLHSWSIKQDDVPEVLDEIWKHEQRHEPIDGIKIEPDPEFLKQATPKILATPWQHRNFHEEN